MAQSKKLENRNLRSNDKSKYKDRVKHTQSKRNATHILKAEQKLKREKKEKGVKEVIMSNFL